MSSAKLSTQPLKGILDFPPDLLARYDAVKKVIDRVAAQNGYLEYDVPILESWETFAVKSATEILDEQSYHFTDRGGRKVILRPEITPSLARLIAKEIKQLPQPVRWYTVGKCYRYERPQKGRLREFRQLNFDILGKKHYLYDIEILRIVKQLMDAFSTPPSDYTIRYNHRELVNLWLKEQGFTSGQIQKFFSLADRRNKLSPKEFAEKSEQTFPTHLQKKVEEYFSTTRLRDLFPPSPSPEVKEFLNDIIGLEDTLEQINSSFFGGKVIFDPGIVRGFDYYTGLVFEVFADSGDIRRSLFGGGRYDDLIGNYINENISGIGFGMGLDIFILFLESVGRFPSLSPSLPGYYIAPLDKRAVSYSLELGEALLHRGLRVEIAPPQKLSKHFNRLNSFPKQQSFIGMILIGEEELEKHCITFKNLESGKQKTFPFTEENLSLFTDLIE